MVLEDALHGLEQEGAERQAVGQAHLLRLEHVSQLAVAHHLRQHFHRAETHKNMTLIVMTSAYRCNGEKLLKYTRGIDNDDDC